MASLSGYFGGITSASPLVAVENLPLTRWMALPWHVACPLACHLEGLPFD